MGFQVRGNGRIQVIELILAVKRTTDIVCFCSLVRDSFVFD